jgi:hypothetical protein
MAVGCDREEQGESMGIQDHRSLNNCGKKWWTVMVTWKYGEW